MIVKRLVQKCRFCKVMIVRVLNVKSSCSLLDLRILLVKTDSEIRCKSPDAGCVLSIRWSMRRSCENKTFRVAQNSHKKLGKISLSLTKTHFISEAYNY